MIKGVRVKATRSPDTPHLNLPIFRYGSGEKELQIVHIDGLTPTPASITTQDRALRGGVDVLGARSQARNIVMTIGYPMHGYGESIWKLRERLYRYFQTGHRVTLTFDVSDPDYELEKSFETEGYVETIEANVFGSDPKIQISVLCPDPYFYDTEALSEVVGWDDRTYLGLSPVDFDTEILSLPLDLRDFDYSEVGVHIRLDNIVAMGEHRMGVMTYYGDYESIQYINYEDGDEYFEIDTQGVPSNRGFELSSVYGDRYVNLLTSNGEVSSALGRIELDATWPSVGGPIPKTLFTYGPIGALATATYEIRPRKLGL